MSKRILILDNEKDILEILENILTHHGFEVKCVSQTEDIFKLIDEYDPHLLLVDYILNGINGGELCHKIKTNPQTMDLPVVIMTGYPKVLKSLGDYGSDAFVEKPFNLSELVKTLNAILEAPISMEQE